jgi:multicomponent Na+:H+ antiporter subunit E
VVYPFKLIVILTMFFIVLTEKLTVLNTVTGIVVSILIVALNKNQWPNIASFNLRKMPLWVWFVVILIKEVVVSNVQVAKIVLSKTMDIAPHVVDYESRLKDEFLLTVYANAITLTPGTMTVDIDRQKMKIHCLNESYAQGLEGSHIERILLRIEGGTHG